MRAIKIDNAALPPIPDAAEIYYENHMLATRPGEQPRKYWLVILWRTPKGRRLDHDSVIEFTGTTWRQLNVLLRRWIRKARAKEVDWPTSWNAGEVA